VVTVTDNGPGIPQALQPEIFNRFVRGDSSRSRAAGSTGLGLAIVSAVVQAHGGTVSVASRAGQTSFTVLLPQHQPRQDVALADRHAAGSISVPG
jgi:two-component system OmpR family sensor kinase